MSGAGGGKGAKASRLGRGGGATAVGDRAIICPAAAWLSLPVSVCLSASVQTKGRAQRLQHGAATVTLGGKQQKKESAAGCRLLKAAAGEAQDGCAVKNIKTPPGSGFGVITGVVKEQRRSQAWTRVSPTGCGVQEATTVRRTVPSRKLLTHSSQIKVCPLLVEQNEGRARAPSQGLTEGSTAAPPHSRTRAKDKRDTFQTGSDSLDRSVGGL